MQRCYIYAQYNEAAENCSDSVYLALPYNAISQPFIRIS